VTAGLPSEADARSEHADRLHRVIFDGSAGIVGWLMSVSARKRRIGAEPEALRLAGLPCNRVERFFNRIKQCRWVATRYDRLAANHLAFVQLASIRLWLRLNESAS
jgi:hypothetical protein